VCGRDDGKTTRFLVVFLFGGIALASRKAVKDTISAWVAVGPALLVQIIFVYVPLAFAAWVSLHRWNMIRPMRWVGMQNYINLMQDDAFWRSMYLTFIYVIGTVPASIALALLLALLLNVKWIKGMAFFRVMFYIPVITAMAAAAVVWGWLFEPSGGLINYLIGTVGISPKGWLNSPDWAMLALIIVGVWKRIGYNTIFFLAGLQTIPGVYYEAARIDGAGPWKSFFSITLPLLSPTTLFVAILQFIASFRVFVSVSVMTQGGPARTTRVITYFLYENAFIYLRMGYASAIAIVMFVLLFLFTLFQFRASRKRVHYQ